MYQSNGRFSFLCWGKVEYPCKHAKLIQHASNEDDSIVTQKQQSRRRPTDNRISTNK